jgi:hypothetical protein
MTSQRPDAALTGLVDAAAVTRWLDAQGFPAGLVPPRPAWREGLDVPSCRPPPRTGAREQRLT